MAQRDLTFSELDVLLKYCYNCVSFKCQESTTTTTKQKWDIACSYVNLLAGCDTLRDAAAQGTIVRAETDVVHVSPTSFRTKMKFTVQKPDKSTFDVHTGHIIYG